MYEKIEIINSKNLSVLATLDRVQDDSTILDIKERLHRRFPKYYPNRQSLRSEPRGKALKDEDILSSINMMEKGKLYFKDLGPQIGWSTVFLAEYAGPLFVYLFFYARPWFIYGAGEADKPMHMVVHLSAACWSFHYAKRILETIFVHRFSKATMPIMNLFKNCGYYWGFAAFVSYFINHPLYTAPMYGDKQIYGGLAGFLFCEYGNFAIHCALRDLRPAGSTKRCIPLPTRNPFTILFKFVSCPNYTYEVGSWVCFSVMCQTLPALIFTALGFYQMAVWAKGKHRNYRKEFKDYPRRRTAILPFLM